MEASYSIKKRMRGKGGREGLVDEDQIVKMEGRKLNSTIGAGWQRAFEYVRYTLQLKAEHGKVYFKFQLPSATR